MVHCYRPESPMSCDLRGHESVTKANISSSFSHPAANGATTRYVDRSPARASAPASISASTKPVPRRRVGADLGLPLRRWPRYGTRDCILATPRSLTSPAMLDKHKPLVCEGVPEGCSA